MLVPYIHICLYYFLTLFSYFHVLFLNILATRHILQFAMSDSISSQPARNITEIKKLHSPRRKKKWRVNYNQNKYSNIIIFATNHEFFLPHYQITFFAEFGRAKIFFSCLVLMNITAWKVFVFGDILVRIFPHSDQNNSEYGHFLRSDSYLHILLWPKNLLTIFHAESCSQS